jgi:pimeloyl-ACP methyl ester carboxylesterase
VKLLLLVTTLAACAPLTNRPPTAHAHFAPVNGLRMYYEDHGQGRPLVLLHGGGSTAQTTFGVILPRLARWHRVIAPEQQGHGHSEDLDRPLSFEQMADDTAALLEQLQIREADVLGFSNGGMTALHLAVRHPGLVRRLVICSGYYARAGFIPGLQEMFERPPNAGEMPKPLRDAYLAAAPRPDLEAFVAKTVAMMRSFTDLSEDQLRAIEAPTLVMMGDQDVFLPEHAAKLARLVKHGQLAILPGAQHGVYLGVAESPSNPRLVELALEMIRTHLATERGVSARDPRTTRRRMCDWRRALGRALRLAGRAHRAGSRTGEGLPG